jgi:hypothetical protein
MEPIARSTEARCQGRTWCRKDFANTYISRLFSEVIAKDPIAVPQQVTRGLLKGASSGQTLDVTTCPKPLSFRLLISGWISTRLILLTRSSYTR